MAPISVSACCSSDSENENGVKIENGIRSLGNESRSGLGRKYANCVKEEAEIPSQLLSFFSFQYGLKESSEDLTFVSL